MLSGWRIFVQLILTLSFCFWGVRTIKILKCWNSSLFRRCSTQCWQQKTHPHPLFIHLAKAIRKTNYAACILKFARRQTAADLHSTRPASNRLHLHENEKHGKDQRTPPRLWRGTRSFAFRSWRRDLGPLAPEWGRGSDISRSHPPQHAHRDFADTVPPQPSAVAGRARGGGGSR